MDTELALTKFRQLPVKTICKSSFVLFGFTQKNYTLDSYPAWSLKDIEDFEEGLREYGKNFFKISVFKVNLSFNHFQHTNN